MNNIAYIPLNEDDARRFFSKIDKIKTATWSGKILNLMPPYWLGRYMGQRELLSEYRSLESNEKLEIRAPESPDIIFAVFSHLSSLKDIKGELVSRYEAQKLYFFHPVYRAYVLMDDYYKAVFSEKLFYWKKLLVGLGAKSIKIKSLSNEFTKIFNYYNIDVSSKDSSATWETSSENRRISESKFYFSQPDNIPDECYLSQKKDYFKDGKYLFKHENSSIEAHKLSSWVYNDDGNIRNVFEARLRHLSLEKLSDLDFDISCRFKKIAFNKDGKKLLLKLGVLDTKFSSLDESELFLSLKVQF